MILAFIASVSFIQAQAATPPVEWATKDFDFGVSVLAPKVEAVESLLPKDDDPDVLKHKMFSLLSEGTSVVVEYKQFDSKSKALDMPGEFINLAVDGIHNDDGEVTSEEYVTIGTYMAYRLTVDHPDTAEVTWTVQKDAELYKFTLRYPKSTSSSDPLKKFSDSISFKTPKSPPDKLESEWHTTTTPSRIVFQSPFVPTVETKPQEINGARVTTSSYSCETPATYYLVIDCVIPKEFYSTLDENQTETLNQAIQNQALSGFEGKVTKREEGKLLGHKSIRTTFLYNDQQGIFESCLQDGNFIGIAFITYPKLIDSPNVKKFLDSLKVGSAK